MAFRYLTDPLFLVCFSAYFGQRMLKTYDLSTPLLSSYLNDVICIPFWIPVMLWVERRVGLRPHDDPPHAFEVVIPLLLWALVFEVALPITKTFSGLAVPDPNDVLCYAVGAFVSTRFWAWWYRHRDVPVPISALADRRQSALDRQSAPLSRAGEPDLSPRER